MKSKIVIEYTKDLQRSLDNNNFPDANAKSCISDKVIDRKDLKACPLCGEKVSLKVRTTRFNFGMSGAIIKCPKCRLSLSGHDQHLKYIESEGAIMPVNVEDFEEEAVMRWNRRSSEPQPTRESLKDEDGRGGQQI